MLNEEKIRLMTKAASYEEKEGKYSIPENNFFKSDFIDLKIIWSWISYTIVYAACLGLWGFYKLDYLMTNLNSMDLTAFAKKLVVLYVIGLVIYLVLTAVYYNFKFNKDRKGLAQYYKILKMITAINEKEGTKRSSAFLGEDEDTEDYDDYSRN